MNTIRYNNLELDPTKNEIRLLELLPETDEHVIRCALGVYDLDKRPEYEAISYAWGDPNDTTEVYINGSPCQVATNLSEFLRARLRNHTRPKQRPQDKLNFEKRVYAYFDYAQPLFRRFWMDSVCIDQRNIGEKMFQVQRMYAIYHHAACVSVWLGKLTGSDHELLTRRKRIGTKDDGPNKESTWAGLDITDTWHVMGWDSDSEGTRGLFDYLTDNAELGASEVELHGRRGEAVSKAKKWQPAVEYLLTQPWWQRIWVVQEVEAGLRHNPRVPITLRWGDEDIGWEHLTVGLAIHAYNLRDWHKSPYPISKGLDTLTKTIYSDLKVKQGTKRTEGLLDLMINYRARLASDPRDKVYSLLGLADTGISLLRSVIPDYSVPPTVLFANIARTVISQTGTLAILEHCQDHSPAMLASWIPDWSFPPNVLHLAADIDWTLVRFNSALIYKRRSKSQRDAVLDDEDAVKPFTASGSHKCLTGVTPESLQLTVRGVIWTEIGQLSERFSPESDQYYRRRDLIGFMKSLDPDTDVALHKRIPAESGATLLENPMHIFPLNFWQTFFADRTPPQVFELFMLDLIAAMVSKWKLVPVGIMSRPPSCTSKRRTTGGTLSGNEVSKGLQSVEDTTPASTDPKGLHRRIVK